MLTPLNRSAPAVAIECCQPMDHERPLAGKRPRKPAPQPMDQEQAYRCLERASDEHGIENTPQILDSMAIVTKEGAKHTKN